MTEELQQILNSYDGDPDEAILSLYEKIKTCDDSTEKKDLMRYYNELADYMNEKRGVDAFKKYDDPND